MTAQPLREVRDLEELLERERAARRHLQAALAARDTLVARLIRELATHTNVIEGWARLLEREMLDFSARASAAQRIIDAAKAQAALLEQLGLGDVGLLDRSLMTIKQLNLGALAAAVAADAGDDVVATVADGVHVRADVGHVVRMLQSLVVACAKPMTLVVERANEKGIVRVGPRKDRGTDAVQVALLLANVHGGDIRVDGDTVILSLPAVDPDP